MSNAPVHQTANDRSEFLRSTPAVDKAVLDATTGPNASFELMKAAMRTQLEREGVITRDPSDPNNELGARLAGGQHGQHAQRTPEFVALPVAPATGARCYRVIYPFANTRCELMGQSEAELDEQERRILAAYGR